MTKSTTTETESNPPAWAQPLFETSAQDAQALYEGDIGGHTYTGSTVAPLSDTTLSGLNSLTQAAKGWDTSSAYTPYYQSIGAAAVSDPYLKGIGDSAGSVTGAANSLGSSASALSGVAGSAGDVYKSASAPTAASTYLSDYASGKYLNGEGNPFYRQRLEGDIADSNALIQSQFSGAGRYGSGANQNTIAKNTSNMLLQGLEDDYNRQQANQLAAVGMMDSSKAQQIASQLGALGLQGDTLSTQGNLYGTQGNLYGQAGNLYGQASTQYGAGLDRAKSTTDTMAGQAQQSWENSLTGAQATLDAGSVLDEQSQKQLSDAVAQWYGLDSQDWTQLGLLQQAAAGAAGTYGSGTSTQTAPVDFGSLLGGLGSMFKKSDYRAKEHVIPLGYFNGFPVYSFAYKGRPERFLGVMAQDVMEKKPEAVIRLPDGYLGVDYRQIGFAPVRLH